MGLLAAILDAVSGKPDDGDDYAFADLAWYNTERSRGVTHTPAVVALMAARQREFDASCDYPGCTAFGTHVEPSSNGSFAARRRCDAHQDIEPTWKRVGKRTYKPGKPRPRDENNKRPA